MVALVHDIAAASSASGAKKGLLRVLTCGSVDDGKSTLIGRLLYDAKLVLDDQLSALQRDSKKSGTTGGLDFSLLLDGLQAEREQAITIDVAYRFAETERRKFIIADAPGHEQYTRNMLTGASTADLAILLVDARKGLLVQTRRHAFICSLLGIRHIVLAINKMDLVEYNQKVFSTIVDAFEHFAKNIGLSNIVAIPVSALAGENVLHPATSMDWYCGPTLLRHLESVDVVSAPEATPFRFPVQLVQRPDQGFRGFSGTIASGTIKPGDKVSLQPSGRVASIARIVTMDGDLDQARSGQAVTLTFAEELDVSRGDMIVSETQPPEFADQFAAHIVWMDDAALLPGRQYLFRVGTQTMLGKVTEIKHQVDVNTLEKLGAKKLSANEVAFCNISLDRPVSFDPYKSIRKTGCFVLIDRYTNATAGAGMIAFGLRRSHNIRWQDTALHKADRAALKRQSGCILWFTGLSGAGKSTVANLVEKRLHEIGAHSYLLDGDNIRHGLNRDLGFTAEDRVENIRRIAEVSKLMLDAGLIVLVSAISPFRNERDMARGLVEAEEFFEIFVDTPLEVCEQRDPKGLYRKARLGTVKNMTGIDSPYEAPDSPDLVLHGAAGTPEQLADQTVALLRQRKIII